MALGNKGFVRTVPTLSPLYEGLNPNQQTGGQANPF